MSKRLHQGLIPVFLIAQILGVTYWWIWIDVNVFAVTSMASMVGKLAFTTFLFFGWYILVTQLGHRLFGWDKKEIGMRDTLAGMLLVILPFTVMLAPYLGNMTAGMEMKLVSSIWLPYVKACKVVGHIYYSLIMYSGQFILLTVILKLVNVLNILFRYSIEKLTSNKLFLIGFISLIALLSWPAILSIPNFGEISQLLVTQALSFDTAWNVDGVLGRGDYYHFYPIQEIGFNGYADGMGRLFLPVAPGMPLLFMTFYLIGGRWFAAVLAMAFAAGAAAHLFGISKEQGYQPKTSFLVWGLSLFTAPLLLYGYQIVEVTAGAFFLTLMLRLLLKIKLKPEANTIALSAGIGFFAGLVWLGGVRMIIPSLILLGLLGLFLKKNNRLKELWVAGLSMLLPAGLALLYFNSVYSIFLNHPVYQFNLPWSPGFWTNLIAMVTDRYSGLLWHSPIWLIAIAGTIWMLRKKEMKDIAIGILLIIASLTVFGMVMPDPRAEGSNINRLLAMALPLTGIGLAVIIEKLQDHQWLKKVMMPLVYWSMGIGLVLTMLPDLTNEAVRIKFLSLFKLDYVYNLLPAFGTKMSIVQWVISLVLFAGAGYFVYVVTRKLEDKNHEQPPASIE